MDNKIVRLGTILFGITAATGLILGAVQGVTEAPIAAQREAQKTAALASVLPGASKFEPLPLQSPNGAVTEAFAASDEKGPAGWCLTVATKGFGGPMTLVAGIDAGGTVRGISILEMNETPGLGARAREETFSGQFAGKSAKHALTVVKAPPEKDNQIQAISGATISSRAVTGAVNAACAYCFLYLSPRPEHHDGYIDALSGASM